MTIQVKLVQEATCSPEVNYVLQVRSNFYVQ